MMGTVIANRGEGLAAALRPDLARLPAGAMLWGFPQDEVTNAIRTGMPSPNLATGAMKSSHPGSLGLRPGADP